MVLEQCQYLSSLSGFLNAFYDCSDFCFMTALKNEMDFTGCRHESKHRRVLIDECLPVISSLIFVFISC